MTRTFFTTLSGSFKKNYEDILKISKELNKFEEIEILSPEESKIINPKDDFVILESDPKDASIKEIEDHHLKSIKRSDFLVVCCPDGKIGNSTLFEIGYAKALGKPVFCIGHVNDKMISQYVAKFRNEQELIDTINRIIMQNRENDISYA